MSKTAFYRRLSSDSVKRVIDASCRTTVKAARSENDCGQAPRRHRRRKLGKTTAIRGVRLHDFPIMIETLSYFGHASSRNPTAMQKIFTFRQKNRVRAKGVSRVAAKIFKFALIPLVP
jgi:hypothetical protein